MDTEEGDSTLDPDYVAGLLDSTARVRFNFTAQPDDTFTVRPQLRIKFYDTELREAVVGTFLDSRDYAYDLVERETGHDFFLLRRRSDLVDLRDYLRGRSTHLSRELEFVTGPAFDRYDTEILDPEDAYRFLLTRDELRHGWRPRGINHRPPSSITERYDFDEKDVSASSLPDIEITPNSSTEYIAGVFDGCCRYRPSIAESSEHEVGYGFYPTARLYRSGVDSALVESVRDFCRTYDLTYGDSSEAHSLRVDFTGANAIRRVLDVVFPHLLVLGDPSVSLLENILPRFDAGRHREKQGFYELVRDFDLVASASGGPFRRREYDPEYFETLWSDELATDDQQQTSDDEPATDNEQTVEYPDSVTLSPEDYGAEIERFGSLADRKARDEDLAVGLKQMYNDRCQICGTRRAKPDGTGYSEVHHLQPIRESDGADTLENMIVLCPNHHADFDNGALSVDIDSMTVEHPYDAEADGTRLTTTEGDALSEISLQYHNEVVANTPPDERGSSG